MITESNSQIQLARKKCEKFREITLNRKTLVEIIVLLLSCKWSILLWRRVPLDKIHVAFVIGTDRIKKVVENVFDFQDRKSAKRPQTTRIKVAQAAISLPLLSPPKNHSNV